MQNSLKSKMENGNYHICLNKDCDVVYYNSDGDEIFYKNQMRTPIWYKKGADPKYICYCKRITEEQVIDAALNKGAKTSQDVYSLSGGMKVSRCDILNPLGTCCSDTMQKIIDKTLNLDRKGELETMSNNSGCCSGSSGCCGTSQEKVQVKKEAKKQLDIDFLYLDLSVCERCQGTETNLDKAVDEVSVVLKSAGYEVNVNKVNIITRELAMKYEFVSSPTIRLNGKDIALEFKESLCQDCGDLCGDSVDCRVWVYEGVEYNEPPKEMIVNAILKEVYVGGVSTASKKEEYVLPSNLEVFFQGLDNQNKK